jgi:ankyrin repeat protein
MNYELHRYAETGNLERVKQLVEGGAYVDETDEGGNTALLLAIRKEQFEIVVYLVEHGADVAHSDGGGMLALHMACILGKLPTVKCLWARGVRITRGADGLTTLLHAAENGSLEVVKFLLSSEGGASLSECDKFGNNALFVTPP